MAEDARQTLAERATSARSGLWATRALRLGVLGALLWCAYAAGVVAFASEGVSTVPMFDAALALILGLLMTIRTNRAYERWWEGRTLWGALVNASRNLAVKVKVYAAPADDEARGIHALIAGFAYSLRDHLRAGARLAAVPGFATAEEDPSHVPSWLVHRLHERFQAWYEAQHITGDELRMLDLESRVLLDVCGGCERIRTTALPPSLTWITRFTIGAALLGIPWFLGAELGHGVVPISGIAAFLVIVVETITAELEHPFGLGHDQLDLSVISGVIDDTTAEILGVEPMKAA